MKQIKIFVENMIEKIIELNFNRKVNCLLLQVYLLIDLSGN